LKIAILHFENTSRPVTGHGTYLSNLSRSLTDKGHSVETLNLFGPHSGENLGRDRLKRVCYSAFLFTITRRLRGHDVILFTEPLYPQNLVLLRYLKLSIRAPIVLWLGAPRITQNFYYFLIKKEFPALVTAGITRPFAEKIASAVEILAPGVDMAKLRPQATDKRWDFLYIGHLFKEKGVLLLLQAMKLLKARNVSVRLKIVHTPCAEEGFFRRFIADNRLDNVEMERAIIENTCFIYNTARVFVYPGIARNRVADVPLTIIEASACGLSVVTTGLYRHVDLPNIIHCQPVPERLAAAMLKAASGLTAQQQAGTLSEVERRHSLVCLGDRAEACFNRLLNGKH
jgi:glycosyltransferase involved in cell wall biosynthesis